MFRRISTGGGNLDGGTLLQLENMLYCRNDAADVSCRFNATIDFVELITNCHNVAPVMNFVSMKKDTTSCVPTSNTLPPDISKNLWNDCRKIFSEVAGQISDH